MYITQNELLYIKAICMLVTPITSQKLPKPIMLSLMWCFLISYGGLDTCFGLAVADCTSLASLDIIHTCLHTCLVPIQSCHNALILIYLWLSGFCCVCHLFLPLVSIFGLFPVLVSCHYDLSMFQLCLSGYVLIIPCILVLSFEFDFFWSTRYSPVFLAMSALPCPALPCLSRLKTIIWVYILVCVFLFLPRVCTVTEDQTQP